MRKLFWENSYQTELTTTVIDIQKGKILFAETIAFSFSGGQESDKACINDMPVVASEMVDQLIYYTLPMNHGLTMGDKVTMTIDWLRRYKLMRLHFAAELILELMNRKNATTKIGAHIAETKARIDFFCSQNISHYFNEILTAYNEIISSNRIIQTGFTDVLNQKRYWKIEGFAQVPCGGTHVKSTGEVGYVNLKRVNIGRGKERIEIYLIEK